MTPLLTTADTHVYDEELLGVVQSLHTDLEAQPMAFAPANHVATEALAGLQRADTGVELGSQPCAGGL